MREPRAKDQAKVRRGPLSLPAEWWPGGTTYLGFLEDGAFACDHDGERPVLECCSGVDRGTVWGGGSSFGLW